jgi:dihydroflavonol-4-reductase
MTIGITGATGFLGASLARRIAPRLPHGDKIVTFGSRHAGNPLTADLGLSCERLDVTDREAVFRLTRGIDILYHAAGSIDFSRRYRARTWNVNVLGTLNILDAAVENHIGRVICVSSICVMGAPADGAAFADETNDRYAPGMNPISFSGPQDALRAVEDSRRGDFRFLERVRIPYFDSKIAAFELALRYASREGLDVVTVLPGTAVGAGDIGLSLAGLVLRVYGSRLAFTLPGGTSFVSAVDAARGIQLAGERGRRGGTYIITGREEDNLSHRDFMRLAAEVVRECYGRRCRRDFLVVPPRLASACARAIESLFSGTALPEGLVLSGCLMHRFRSSRAKEELGYEPQVPLRDSIRACIDFTLRVIGEKSA